MATVRFPDDDCTVSFTSHNGNNRKKLVFSGTGVYVSTEGERWMRLEVTNG